MFGRGTPIPPKPRLYGQQGDEWNIKARTGMVTLSIHDTARHAEARVVGVLEMAPEEVRAFIGALQRMARRAEMLEAQQGGTQWDTRRLA